MNKIEFISKLKDIADNYNTIYMWGVFGAPVTKSLLNEKSKQYPNWYTTERIKLIEKCIGKDYFAFDCVNLIKGILWGWKGTKNNPYGGAIYPNLPIHEKQIREGKLIPDVSADNLINMCHSVSTDYFSNIEPGEVVWLKGHIGVSIGNNTIIECTPSWDNGVQYTSLGNLINSNKSRVWTKHGKLPWIEYNDNKEKNWIEILNIVSTTPNSWVNTINDFNEVLSKSNLGNLEILQYFSTLIEKVYKLQYTGPLSWTEIVSRVSTQANEWKVAIDAIVGAAKSEGDIGNIEIFRFIPELIVKIYNLNK